MMTTVSVLDLNDKELGILAKQTAKNSHILIFFNLKITSHYKILSSAFNDLFNFLLGFINLEIKNSAIFAKKTAHFVSTPNFTCESFVFTFCHQLVHKTQNSYITHQAKCYILAVKLQ